MRAEGPGTVYISRFLSLHSLTNLYPGSDMRGVPASDTNAIFIPSDSSLIIFGLIRSPLISLYIVSFVIMSYCFNSLLVISLRKTPDLDTGSKKVTVLSDHNSLGKESNIWFATFGGVKTSSLLKFARQVSISGL